MKGLSDRLDRLEQAGAAGTTVFIWPKPDESDQQAQARWLAEHPDRRSELQRAGGRTRFVRRVFVEWRGPGASG
jgi:hypothetical protein